MLFSMKLTHVNSMMLAAICDADEICFTGGHVDFDDHNKLVVGHGCLGSGESPAVLVCCPLGADAQF